MVAKPWKCTMVVGVGLALLLVAGCTKPKANETTSTTPAAVAAAADTAQPPTVTCSNQNNHPDQDTTLVDRVLLLNKNGTVLGTVKGTGCGVVWDNAAKGNIPTEKRPKGTLATTTVCVWMGDHWECGTNTLLTDSSTKAGIKK